jgi:lipopolysaccharide/colanic/teichoic acid biosynthesis glycosyltransferase
MFDVTCAALGLVLLSPLFVVIGLVVKLKEGGPIFYSHSRVGKGFRHFRLFKFRSMAPNSDATERSLTVFRDPRVTGVGRVLRKYKLDELPQLFNVIRGDMSLVGPRPESERYVTMFRSQYESILLHRPGITDPATLAYRDEEYFLPAEDADREYVQKILPLKLELSLEYLRRRTFLSDCALIARTVTRLFSSQQD